METRQIKVDDFYFNVMGNVQNHIFKVEQVIWKRFNKDGSVDLINITELLIILGGVAIMQRIEDECNF